MKPGKKSMPARPDAHVSPNISPPFLLNPESTDPILQFEAVLIPINQIPPCDRDRIVAMGTTVSGTDALTQRLARLEEENRHLRSLSVTDELTGLFNKRFFNRQLDIEVARTRRTGEPFCLVFIDLDDFKIVNDTRGHATGDAFLVDICRRLRDHVRPTDFACRFGGDEFVLILPATTLRDALMIADRSHQLIRQVAKDMKVPVSSSIGVDEFNTASTLNADEFIRRVDAFLYDAKKSGKGTIVHPETVATEQKAVTPAEKETLYHLFHPPKRKPPQKGRTTKR